MEIKRKRRVQATEALPIPEQTKRSLLDTIRGALRQPHAIERLRYTRGDEYILVERMVPEDHPSVQRESAEDDFLTAHQMVRQHAALEVQEPYAAPLESVARAVQSLTSRKFRVIMFVAESHQAVRAWMGRDIRIEDVWQVPLHEDPEAHEPGLFVCGSRSGTMIRDIEAAVFCRMS